MPSRIAVYGLAAKVPTVRCTGLVAVVIGSLWLAASVRADDWPQYLGPQQDAVWRETGIVDRFPEGGPPLRWRVAIGGGYSGPAVAEGKVFVTDRQVASESKDPSKTPGKIAGTERILCLNEADGLLLWKHEYDCPYRTVQYPAGPRTTPIVRDHKVYTLGAEGNLFCLDVETGKPLWSHDLKKDYGAKTQMWGFSAHPLLDGQKLICMVGGAGSAVVAFDKDTGTEIWRALTVKSLGYCPPMIYEAAGKRQLIIWHGEAINGLDPETGKVYWTEPFTAYSGMAIAAPRKLGDYLFITSTYAKSMMLRLGSDSPSAAVVWKGDRKTSFDSVFATPFLEDGYIYGTSSDGELCCVEIATGKRLWATFEPNGGKKARSADLFLVKNGDRFFIANEKGDLIIGRLSPKGYQEISRTHLREPTSSAFGRSVVWSHPAFANRSAYLRNDKEIVCVSLAATSAGR